MSHIIMHVALPSTGGVVKTWAWCKAYVSETIGHNANDPRYLAKAAKEIMGEIAEWNRRHTWNILAKSSVGIPLVAGQSAYTLPADFSHEYSVRIEGDAAGDRPLAFMPKREIDWIWDKPEDIGSPPFWYTDFLFGSGQLEIFPPAVSSVGEIFVRYFATISEPTSDDAVFNIPDKWLMGILDGARSRFIANQEAETNRSLFWLAKGGKAFTQAMADDNRSPNEIQRMKPGIEVGGQVDMTTAAYALARDGGA